MRYLLALSLPLFFITFLSSQIELEYLNIYSESGQAFYGQSHPKMIVDNEGNAIISGTIGSSVSFSDGYSLSNTGAGRDLFILKRNDAGERLWAIKLATSDDNSTLNAIKVDLDGNILIAGRVNGNIQMNPAGGASISTPNNPKGFVAKYSSDGTYLWHREFISTSWFTAADDLALDDAGNVYVTGDMGNDFHLGSITLYDSAPTVFCFKLNPNGGTEWVDTYLDCLTGTSEKIIYVDGALYVISAYGGSMDFDPGPGQSYVAALGDNDLYFTQINANSGERLNVGPIRSAGKQRLKSIQAYDGGFAAHISDYDENDKLTSTRLITRFGSTNVPTFTKSVNASNGSIQSFYISADNILTTSHTNNYSLVFDPTSAITPLVFSGDGYSYLQKEHPSVGVFHEPNIPTSGVVVISSIVQTHDAIYLSGTFFGSCSFELNPDELNVSSGRYMKAFVAKYSNCVEEKELVIEGCDSVEYEGVSYESSGEYQSLEFTEEECASITKLNIVVNTANATINAYEDHISGSFGAGTINWYSFPENSLVESNTKEIFPPAGQYYAEFIDNDGCEYLSKPLTVPTRRVSDSNATRFGKNIFTSGNGEVFVETTRNNWGLLPLTVTYPEVETEYALVSGFFSYTSVEKMDEYTIVGTDSFEEAFVYDENDSSPISSGRIKPAEVASGTIGGFGRDMAVYEDYIFVGAPETTLSGGEDVGIVQIFELKNGSFKEVDFLISLFAYPNFKFGSRVHVIGNSLYIFEPGYSNSFGAGRFHQYEMNIIPGLSNSTLELTLSGFIVSSDGIGDFKGDLASINGQLLVLGDDGIALVDPISHDIEDIYQSDFALSKLSGNDKFAVCLSDAEEGESKEAIVLTVNDDNSIEEFIRYYSNDVDENFGSGVAITPDQTVLVGAEYAKDNNADGVVYYYNLNDFLETSTEEIQEKIALTIYPNPVHTSFTIDSEFTIEKVKVFDVMGNEVTSTNSRNIDASKLPTGVYIVSIILENDKMITKKIVKN